MWSAPWGGLRWVDMLPGDILHLAADGRVAATTCRHRRGGPASAARGGAVIAVERGFALEAADGTLTTLPEVWSDPGVRMNDGGCDPDGRFYCGSMAYDERPGGGALFRLDPDGAVHQVLGGVTISNGLEWSPDGTLAYYNDTPTGRIARFDYDVAAGLTSMRTFAEVPAEQGYPDGLTVDADGGVWVALYGGGAVQHYTPRAGWTRPSPSRRPSRPPAASTPTGSCSSPRPARACSRTRTRSRGRCSASRSGLAASRRGSSRADPRPSDGGRSRACKSRRRRRPASGAATPTPASRAQPARMFARCGGECIHAFTVAAGVAFAPVPHAMFSASDQATEDVMSGATSVARWTSVSPPGEEWRKKPWLTMSSEWRRAALASRASDPIAGRCAALRSLLRRQTVARWISASLAAVGVAFAPAQLLAAAGAAGISAALSASASSEKR